jgi:glutathione synthase/RimK-type ligase-like ATP-grasp enzyme
LADRYFLLLTHSLDYYCVDRVAAHLKKAGYQALRLNTDQYPQKYKTRFHLSGNGFSIRIGRHEVTENNLAACWIRKILFGQPDEVLRSLLHRLSQRPVLDPFDRILLGENKLRQLELAAACDLNLPEGILTNDWNQARMMMARKDRKYITKLLRPTTWSMDDDTGFFYTSFVEHKQLSRDHFSVHPLLIQEFIPKQYELRVAYVAGNCFTGKIAVNEMEADWRKPGSTTGWSAYTLPETVQKKLQRFMKKIGLQYGAIDLIRGLDGRYYFLEVNPVGEWGMLEKFLGLPISEAIARHLIYSSK